MDRGSGMRGIGRSVAWVLFLAGVSAPPGRSQEAPAQPAPAVVQEETVAEDLYKYVELKSLREYYGPILCARFFNRGTQIVSCGKDKLLRVWDAPTGRPIRELRGHKGWVLFLAVKPDNKSIASVGRDGQLIIWDAASGRIVRAIKPSEDKDNFPISVAYHPTLDRVAVGMRMGTVLEFDISTGQRISERRAASVLVFGVAYSPNGKLLAGSGFEVTKIWDLEDPANDTQVGKHPGADIRAVAFSANSKFLVSGGTEGQTMIFDVKTGRVGRIFQGHEGPVISVAFDHVGNYVASAGADGVVYIWDIRGGKALHRIEGHRIGAYSVDFSPDDSQLLSSALDSTMRIWKVDDGSPIRTQQGHGGFIHTVAFTPDDRHLAVGGVEFHVRMWSMRDFKPSIQLKGKEWDDTVTRIAFNPQDQSEIAVGHALGTIKTWSYTREEVESSVVAHTRDVTGLAFVGGGKYLVSSGVDSNVLVTEMRTKKVIKTLQHVGRATFVAAHPNPREPVFASSDESGFIQIIRIGDKRTEWQAKVINQAHKGEITCLQFSPDGSLLASGGADRKVKIWNVKTGKLVRETAGHRAEITGVAFHPDGKYLASSSKDGTVRVRKVEDGLCVQVLEGYSDEVYCLSYNSDGDVLATGAADGEVKLWNRQKRDDR